MFQNQQSSNSSSNRAMVPEAKQALNNMKFEIANELGIQTDLGLLILNSIGPMGLAQKKIFYNCDDFKAFMENQYDTWYGYAYPGNFGSTLEKEYGKIVNSDGEIICEYYFRNSLNRSIRFTESSEDKMPVTVVTQQAYNSNQHQIQQHRPKKYGNHSDPSGT